MRERGRQRTGLSCQRLSDLIPVETKIFSLVSPLGKDRQPPESISAHRNITRKIRRSEPASKNRRSHMLDN